MTTEPPVPSALRILIVERDPDVTDLLSALLEAEGHHVYSARSGREGFALAVLHCPDAIFSGLALPDLSGFAFAAQVRSTPRIAACLMVALTGRGRQSDVELGKGVGFDHFLIKPASLDQILATLQPLRIKAAASGIRTQV